MPVTNDIFGYKRNAKPNAVFSSEDSSLIISSAATEVAKSAFLVQNWNMTYSQTVEEMFEIGSNNIYWMKGRPVGQGQIGRVVGPMGPSVSGGAGSLFPPEAFDLCKGGCSFTIQAVSGHCEKTVFFGETVQGFQDGHQRRSDHVHRLQHGCTGCTAGRKRRLALLQDERRRDHLDLSGTVNRRHDTRPRTIPGRVFS